MKIVALMFLTVYAVICIKNIKKAFWIGMTFMMAYPLGPYTATIDMLDVFTVGNNAINLIHMIPILLFVVLTLTSLKVYIAKNMYGFAFVILIMTYGIGVLISIKDNLSFISDFQKFFISVLWIYISLGITSEKDFRKLLDCIVNGVLINICLSILLAKIGPHISGLVREGASNQSNHLYVSSAENIYIIVILMMISAFMKGDQIRKNIKLYFTGTLAVYYMLFEADSRTPIFVVLLSSLALFFFYFKNYHEKKLVVRYISYLSIGMLAIAGSIFFLSLTESSLFFKIKNMSLSNIFTNENDTLLTRINTIHYYSKKIIESPMGWGFGKVLPLINQWGRFHGSTSYYTDNAFINIGMKSGIISLLAYLIWLLYPIQRWWRYKIKAMTPYIIMYIGYIFATLMMTSQGVSNYPVAIVLCIFNSVMVKSILYEKRIAVRNDKSSTYI